MLARPQVSSVRLQAERSEINKLGRRVLLDPTVSPLATAENAERYFAGPGRAQRACFESSTKCMFQSLLQYVRSGTVPPFFVNSRNSQQALHPYVQALRWAAFYGYYNRAYSAVPTRRREYFRAAVGAVDAAEESGATAGSKERGAVVVVGLISALGECGVRSQEVRNKLGRRCFTRVNFWREGVSDFTRDLAAELELINQSRFSYYPQFEDLQRTVCSFVGGELQCFRAAMDAVDSDGSGSSTEEEAVELLPPREQSSDSVGSSDSSSSSSLGSSASSAGEPEVCEMIAESMGGMTLTRADIGLGDDVAAAPAAEGQAAANYGARDTMQTPFMFLCPITQEAMRDPVTAQDGYNYERSSLVRWLRRKQISPMTRQPMQARVFTNHPLRNAIEEFMARQDQL